MLKRTIEAISNIEFPHLDPERFVLVRRVARQAWLAGARYAAARIRGGRMPSEAEAEAEEQVRDDEVGQVG